MRKVDVAIKQKEVKDKVTPRGSASFNFSMPALEFLKMKNHKRESGSQEIKP